MAAPETALLFEAIKGSDIQAAKIVPE